MFGQNQNSKKIFRTWVNGSPAGYLSDLKDSSIVLSPLMLSNAVSTFEVNVKNIHSIELGRKGSVGRGIVLGVLSGFALGY